MKDKKLLIIFLCFILVIAFILPIKISHAGFFDWAKKIGGFFSYVAGYVTDPGKLIADIVYGITKGIHFLLWWVNNSLVAPIINYLSQLDPFKGISGQSPVSVIWNILKNLAYIILVFSALSAGFEWLIGKDESAKRLIFNIIVVALIINFTFVLIKEAFYLVKAVEDGITGTVKIEGAETEQPASGYIGTIMAASLWQGDPFKEIFAATQGEDKSRSYFAEIIGYIFVIALDMAIFIILFVTALLFVARYIYLVFLAGVSPIAVASLTFPEFKGVQFKGVPGSGETFSGLNIFNKWLNYLVSWLLVVPVFVILVILGNVLKENVLGQVRAENLIQFVMLLFVIGGWYIISLIIAKKLSKGASKMAEIAATTLLLGAGGYAAKGLMSLSGGKVGSMLTKAGDFLLEKVPASRLTAWMSGPAQAIKNAGLKLSQKSYESQAKLAEAKMNIYRERLERETNKKKIAAITTDMVNLVQKFKNNPYVLSKLNTTLNQVSQRDFEKIATNPQALSQLQSANLDQSTIDILESKIKNLSTRTKRQILSDQTLLNTFSGLQAQLKNAFVEGIEKMSSEDVIKQIATGGTQVLNQIAQDQQLLNAVNKVSKGLFIAIQSGITQNVANSLSKLDLDTLENFDDIQSLANQLNPNLNLNQSVKDALKTNPILIFKAALSSTTLKNIIMASYPTANDALNDLDPNRQDPILDNLANLVLP